jgi:hypothetical protein
MGVDNLLGSPEAAASSVSNARLISSPYVTKMLKKWLKLFQVLGT